MSYSILMSITLLFSQNTLFFNAQKISQDSVDIKEITISDYFEMIEMSKDNDKVLMVNFWASWCAPCIKELPVLSNFAKENTNITELIFVSLDRSKDVKKAEKLLTSKDVKGQHYLVLGSDSELSQITDEWFGAVPLTIIYQNGKIKHVYKKELTNANLEKLKLKLTNN